MPTLGDAIRTREQADRATKYESDWRLYLHIEPYRSRDAEEGIAAMRDIYNALADQPIASWQREAVWDADNVSAETLGEPIGRGLIVRRCQYPDAGNPRDGWPRDLDVATAGLPSLHISAQLSNDSPYFQTYDNWQLASGLTFSIRSNGDRKRIRDAIVERFAPLGYVDTTPSR